MSKSYVSMEQKLCTVCGKSYDSGAILLDRRLKESMERCTVTGFGMCEEHQALADKGYIALVGVDESKSEVSPDGNILPQHAYRTGHFIHMKKEACLGMFNIPEDKIQTVIFVEQQVVEMLEQKAKEVV